MDEMKRCPHCSTWKPVGDFSWADRTHTRRAGWCKKCIGAKAKECRQRKIEQYRAANRRWNKAHPETIRKTHRAWSDAHPHYERDRRAAQQERIDAVREQMDRLTA